MWLSRRFQIVRGIASDWCATSGYVSCEWKYKHVSAHDHLLMHFTHKEERDNLQDNKNLTLKKCKTHLFWPKFSETHVKWIPVFHKIYPELHWRESFILHVCEHVYARVLSVLHYVSSDLQRGTEGIFSPLRLELSVKCLSFLIISIRVTGDRAFCSERTYCKNCQIEFVSRSNISIYSGS